MSHKTSCQQNCDCPYIDPLGLVSYGHKKCVKYIKDGFYHGLNGFGRCMIKYPPNGTKLDYMKKYGFDEMVRKEKKDTFCNVVICEKKIVCNDDNCDDGCNGNCNKKDLDNCDDGYDSDCQNDDGPCCDDDDSCPPTTNDFTTTMPPTTVPPCITRCDDSSKDVSIAW